MYGLKYNESMSTKIHEHYTFIDENYCTVISARCDLPIELIIYHERKEFSIYHMYYADEIIADDISECIDNNLDLELISIPITSFKTLLYNSSGASKLIVTSPVEESTSDK